ncbi:hypothetical protein [Paraburkholderia lycopersici]|uniref:Uncharacterized protein n=1 Tax=Paraburkholderia lycopersici TaxID=416944 RepID=A0A1G6GVN7_9BURK|nr:hypothetical protein [Paraburkholderia lycopersici]SDB85988.1 hypothetical protein SAMN05421548_101382 [Paraburkholderia lycopersici]
MTEDEQQQKADEAYHERWMAQYGFVPPPDPEHPITKKFWELEAAYHEWREAFLLRRFQDSQAVWDAIRDEIPH